VLSPYLNLWHDVYMDNYYNSVKVAEELLKHTKQTSVAQLEQTEDCQIV